MKKQIKFANDLVINKETVTRLNEEQLQSIAGGNYGINPNEEDANALSCLWSSCNGQQQQKLAD